MGRSPGLSDDDLIALGDRAFEGLGAAVLAVSGGPDSMALVAMAQRWRAPRGRRDFPIHVATVDHGLRTTSASEAEWVAAQTEALGLRAHVLAWSGPKPATAIQAAARTARYDLLSGLVERLHLPRPVGLIVAHHRDDQAETFLMRLARGSGIDGLAGMPAERSLVRGQGVLLRRPLLGLDKTTLIATLARLGHKWIDDPTNANLVFERVRVRDALGVLDGLGVTAAAIATSSRRLARARSALESATADLALRALRTHAGAYAEVDTRAFDAAPEEIRVRLMQLVIERFGAGVEPVRLSRLENLVDRLAAGRATGCTLGGCRLERRADAIIGTREPGRTGLPAATLEPGHVLIWDNRFRVACAQGHSGAVEVRALCAQALKQLQDESMKGTRGKAGLPRRAALTLPAFWQHGRLQAVPHPAIGLFGDGSLRAEFIHSNSMH